MVILVSLFMRVSMTFDGKVRIITFDEMCEKVGLKAEAKEEIRQKVIEKHKEQTDDE